jgi:hypothetical protein
MYHKCKHYGIPYCAPIRVLVLSKAGMKMAARAVETCSHTLSIYSTYYCESLLFVNVNIHISIRWVRRLSIVYVNPSLSVIIRYYGWISRLGVCFNGRRMTGTWPQFCVNLSPALPFLQISLFLILIFPPPLCDVS